MFCPLSIATLTYNYNYSIVRVPFGPPREPPFPPFSPLIPRHFPTFTAFTFIDASSPSSPTSSSSPLPSSLASVFLRFYVLMSWHWGLITLLGGSKCLMSMGEEGGGLVEIEGCQDEVLVTQCGKKCKKSKAESSTGVLWSQVLNGNKIILIQFS